ncbi:MAG: hypothetical protein RI897_1513 [Verrucomicrobiota bacterium]|jgi:hypothetical protein
MARAIPDPMPLPPPVTSTFLSANDIAMVGDRIDWWFGGKPAEFGGAEFRWRDSVALGLAGWGREQRAEGWTPCVVGLGGGVLA